MALKFLNKKGWHTGSLRNIENVWKAEQKHEAEQKKLEELRKQIQEERDRTEFRLLQEQAGLVPKQERLDFLYDSGLAVGKNSGTGAGFKALESAPKTDAEAASSSSTKQQQSAVPGALFEEKPQSANDAWRKLHSDPLLLIRQREQEALAHVRNNPIQMAMIRKSVEGKKHRESTPDGKEHRKKHHHKKSKHRKHSSKDHSDEYSERGEHRKINDHKVSKYDEPLHKSTYPPKDHSDEDSEHGEHRKINDHKGSKYDEPSHKSTHRSEELRERDMRKNKYSDNDLKYKERPQSASADQTTAKDDHHSTKRYNDDSLAEKHYLRGHNKSDYAREKREDRKSYNAIPGELSDVGSRRELHLKRRNPVKLSEEERAARLREMQMDAELHEEQRWKRLRKAEENDAQEAIRESMSGGKNFLDATQRSIYGAEKGGSSTIEESVRRRTHYLQDRSEVGERNAFRR